VPSTPNPEVLKLGVHETVTAKSVPILLSVQDINPAAGKVEITVGARGLPNVKDTLRTGDFVVFDFPGQGLFEIRLLNIGFFPHWAALSVSNVASPAEAGGPATGPSLPADNTPFSAEELLRLSGDVTRIYHAVSRSGTLSDEQATALRDHLDYLSRAASRVGRKDWVLLAIGSFANLIVAAALSPTAAREMLRVAARILSWLTGGTPLLP